MSRPARWPWWRKDEEPTATWVTDLEMTEGMRFTFIRLVPRGTTRPARSFTIDFADIDVDEHGNIIGITIPRWDSG